MDRQLQKKLDDLKECLSNAKDKLGKKKCRDIFRGNTSLFESIPADVSLLIMQALDPEDVKLLCQTSSIFRELCRHKYWNSIIQQQTRVKVPKGVKGTYELYRKVIDSKRKITIPINEGLGGILSYDIYTYPKTCDAVIENMLVTAMNLGIFDNVVNKGRDSGSSGIYIFEVTTGKDINKYLIGSKPKASRFQLRIDLNVCKNDESSSIHNFVTNGFKLVEKTQK